MFAHEFMRSIIVDEQESYEIAIGASSSCAPPPLPPLLVEIPYVLATPPSPKGGESKTDA